MTNLSNTLNISLTVDSLFKTILMLNGDLNVEINNHSNNNKNSIILSIYESYLNSCRDGGVRTAGSVQENRVPLLFFFIFIFAYTPS